ncbi:uncharacterized protein ACIBXB_003930 isoform 1-T1 [Morphnus guianensis]
MDQVRVLSAVSLKIRGDGKHLTASAFPDVQGKQQSSVFPAAAGGGGPCNGRQRDGELQDTSWEGACGSCCAREGTRGCTLALGGPASPQLLCTGQEEAWGQHCTPPEVSCGHPGEVRTPGDAQQKGMRGMHWGLGAGFVSSSSSSAGSCRRRASDAKQAQQRSVPSSSPSLLPQAPSWVEEEGLPLASLAMSSEAATASSCSSCSSSSTSDGTGQTPGRRQTQRPAQSQGPRAGRVGCSTEQLRSRSDAAS